MVVRWLQSHGFYVIPSYDYAGENGDKAPRMFGLRSRHALPDLDVAKGGRRKWVEVKTKTRSTLHRITQRVEHGLEERLWDDYTKVQSETGNEVYLAIYELSTDTLLMAPIDTLRPLARRSMWGRRKMIYFPRDAFTPYERKARGGEAA
jgi:hypothetical protein